jgi:hypothetical protein
MAAQDTQSTSSAAVVPSTMTTARTSSTTTDGIANNGSCAVAHSVPPVVQNMTFSGLRQLLLQLVESREMYESYLQRRIVFRVRLCKRIGPNSNFFDVVRVKSRGVTGGKKNKGTGGGGAGRKYEYFISAAFVDPDSNAMGGDPNDAHSTDGFLSCQIHPTLLDPHFEVSAADLRSISRTDRGECGRITDKGGNQVRGAYFSSRHWQATLHLTADEVFGTDATGSMDVAVGRTGGNTASLKSPKELLVNLKVPILLLERPEDC